MEKPKHFVIDVDGVMTDGHFYYSECGQMMKAFGVDDGDGLALLARHMDIRFVTGDSFGRTISERRIVTDLGYRLDFVRPSERPGWIHKTFPSGQVAYMGDGLLDVPVFEAVAYRLAPANAQPATRAAADYVTQARGGSGAVAEACLHLQERFFSNIGD